MKFLILGLIAIVLLIPIPIFAQYSGSSVIDFDELEKQAIIAEHEKEKQEQDLKKQQEEEVLYLRANVDCRDIDTLVNRIDLGNWQAIDSFKVGPDAYSPILWITTEKINYDLELFYTNGESEKQFIKDNYSQHVLYKSMDNKIESIKISKSPYIEYESLIKCDEPIYQKTDILDRANQMQQIKNNIELERQKGTQIRNLCNHFENSCMVSYNVEYKINAPNAFFKESWTKDLGMDDFEKIDVEFGNSNGNEFGYEQITHTKDKRSIKDSGFRAYTVGAFFILRDGVFLNNGVQYYSENKIINVAGNSRESAHIWSESIIDSFAGLGTIREDHYYDLETGLLLRTEYDRELLDVAGVTNTESYKIELSSVNFPNNNGGGCLIATATYGSELAPQVQQLRELRDNSLLSTESGSNFMNLFNDVYYSFSPVIADYERANPVFKEMVKLFITPMITSLSILNYVEMDSESSVLGYGISLIILNVMMYVGIPVLAVMRFRK
mgnify:CR=1 FL=1|jgi:hypothetical protein